MASTHRWVIGGLLVMAFTGTLMALADLTTFLHSPAFWMKMLLILLLAGNGAVLTRVAPRFAAGPSGSWHSMRALAASSLFLWLAATLAGVILNTTS